MERGALIALAAGGGRLNEVDGLRRGLGVSFTSSHRANLIRLQLIERVDADLRITDRGWAWLLDEVGAARPSGSMGLGPLYAVLRALRDGVARNGLDLRTFLTGSGHAAAPAAPQDAYSTLLADAAWVEAENAIALALQDMPSFSRTLKRLESLPVDSAGHLRSRAERQVALAAEQVFQSIRLAAFRRGLVVDEERGVTIPFDPIAYESDFPTRQGEPVVVLKSAVVRKADGVRTVVARGMVEPC